MTRRFVLGEHEGMLCVVEESPMHDKPVLVRSYWPLGRSAGEFFRDYEVGPGHEVREDRPYEEYSFRHTCYDVVLRIPPGSSQAKTEREPIPQPKVRKGVEVRYYNGRWEKYTKKEGWQAA